MSQPNRYIVCASTGPPKASSGSSGHGSSPSPARARRNEFVGLVPLHLSEQKKPIVFTYGALGNKGDSMRDSIIECGGLNSAVVTLKHPIPMDRSSTRQTPVPLQLDGAVFERLKVCVKAACFLTVCLMFLVYFVGAF